MNETESIREQAESIVSLLEGAQLVVVTGKGGVGKTTLAALIARTLAARRKALLLEVDPRENAHRILGMPPSGGQSIQVSPKLWLQNLRPQHVLDRHVRHKVKVDLLARKIIDHPVYQHFSEGAPGLKELAILEHARRQINRGWSHSQVDVVVLDAPATGHGLSLLRAPELVASTLTGGPFASLGHELHEFVTNRRKTAAVVVSSAEEMPIEESIELLGALKELRISPSFCVVNGVYPPWNPFFQNALPVEVAELWSRRWVLEQRGVERLTREWRGPLFEIPLVDEVDDDRLLNRLAKEVRRLR